MFPVLAMLSRNAAEVSLGVALRPLIISLLATSIIFIIFRLTLKRWERAALVTSFLLLLFFSYGQVYLLLEENPVAGFNLGRHRYLIVIYTLVLIVGSWGLFFKVKNSTQVLWGVNVISLVLLAVPVVQLSLFVFQTSSQQQVIQTSPQLDPPLEPEIIPLPDPAAKHGTVYCRMQPQ
jgi:hypothetical protein